MGEILFWFTILLRSGRSNQKNLIQKASIKINDELNGMVWLMIKQCRS